MDTERKGQSLQDEIGTSGHTLCPGVWPSYTNLLCTREVEKGLDTNTYE